MLSLEEYPLLTFECTSSHCISVYYVAMHSDTPERLPDLFWRVLCLILCYWSGHRWLDKALVLDKKVNDLQISLLSTRALIRDLYPRVAPHSRWWLTQPARSLLGKFGFKALQRDGQLLWQAQLKSKQKVAECLQKPTTKISNNSPHGVLSLYIHIFNHTLTY